MSSSKINQQESHKLAKIVLKPKRKFVDEASKTLQDMVIRRLKREKRYVDVFNALNNPQLKPFIRTSNRISFIGNGWNGESIRFDKSVPDLSRGCSIAPTVDFSKEILPIFNEIESKEKEIDILHVQLYTAFKSLGSFKSIIKEFPETEETLLSWTGSKNVPATTFDKLRDQLKSN